MNGKETNLFHRIIASGRRENNYNKKRRNNCESRKEALHQTSKSQRADNEIENVESTAR